LDPQNFLRNIGQGAWALQALLLKTDIYSLLPLADALRRKFIVAIAECARQIDAFKEINKCIPAAKRAEWQKKIDIFIED